MNGRREAREPSNLCIKCGVPWNGETGKYQCPKGGQCDIPAARKTTDKASTYIRKAPVKGG